MTEDDVVDNDTPPKKYIGLHLNEGYVTYIEDKLKAIETLMSISERWGMDTTNKLDSGEICSAVDGDIRKILDLKNE
jgi:hypothetical protein